MRARAERRREFAAYCLGRLAWLDADAQRAVQLFTDHVMVREEAGPEHDHVGDPIYNLRFAMKRSAATMSSAMQARSVAVAFGVVWDGFACPGGGACPAAEKVGDAA